MALYPKFKTFFFIDFCLNHGHVQLDLLIHFFLRNFALHLLIKLLKKGLELVRKLLNICLMEIQDFLGDPGIETPICDIRYSEPIV